MGQVIFARWPTDNLVVSPYVLGEFIQRGQQLPYKKDPTEIMQVVASRILPSCKVAFFRGDMGLAKAYDRIGLPTKYLVNVQVEGTARDQGHEYPRSRGRFGVTRAGQIVTEVYAGLPQGAPGPDPHTTTFDADSKVTVEAPAVELILFDSAAQLVEKTGATWKDAFHYLYAGWENADFIVTTDEKFIDRSKAKGHKLPEVVKPSHVEDHCGVFPGLHQAVFDPS